MPAGDFTYKVPFVLKIIAMVIAFTILLIFGAATEFFIPNNKQSNSLVVESLIPVVVAGMFGLITGFLAGGDGGSVTD